MTSVAPKLPPLMDVAEFLEWPGDGTATRYELVDGVLRAMAPPSDTHGTIQSNLIRLLANHLIERRPNCRVVTTPGVQPRIRADWNFRIPGIGVTCAPNVPGVVMMPDPILLIEILSPGNASASWDNIWAYASMPCVLELAVVHGFRLKAEVLRKDADGAWPERAEIVEAGGTLRLASIRAEFAMAEIYAGTYLAAG